MSKNADKYRDKAKHALEKAKKAQSDEEGFMERNRSKALTDLANNEDWLEGKVKPDRRRDWRLTSIRLRFFFHQPGLS